MARPQRLVTSLELDARADAPTQTRRYSITALHELELADGRRVVLLDDRGWSAGLSGPGDVWSFQSVEGLAQTARAVVGPDDPAPGSTPEEATEGYWVVLAARAEEQGVAVQAAELAGLRHDVEVGAGIRSRLERAAE